MLGLVPRLSSPHEPGNEAGTCSVVAISTSPEACWLARVEGIAGWVVGKETSRHAGSQSDNISLVVFGLWR